MSVGIHKLDFGPKVETHNAPVDEQLSTFDKRINCLPVWAPAEQALCIYIHQLGPFCQI
jgi:hypothetical protein